MKTKFIDHNSDELIIFLMGWGSDYVQYRKMTSMRDLLICWDYSDLSFDFDFSKKQYKNIYLITYSAGTFIAGLIQDKLPKFKSKIAVNGNPKLFDDYYGIDKTILNSMYEISENSYIDFRRKYLVYDEQELKEFSKNEAERSFESCCYELQKLFEYYKQEHSEMTFTSAIISDSDKIFNPQRQMEYFKGKYRILKKQAHNVFVKFTSYDNIIEYAEKSRC